MITFRSDKSTGLKSESCPRVAWFLNYRSVRQGQMEEAGQCKREWATWDRRWQEEESERLKSKESHREQLLRREHAEHREADLRSILLEAQSAIVASYIAGRWV